MSGWRTLWLLIPLVVLAELLAHLHFSRVAPRIEDWARVRSTVAELRRGGELVVVAPRWAEPVARAAFGAQLMPFEDLTRADESGYARAIEVSALGAASRELEGWRQLERREVGDLTVRVLENPKPAKALFRFVDELSPDQAAVGEGHEGDWLSCPWTDRGARRTGGLHGSPAFPQRRFDCASSTAVFVGVTVIDDQQYLPRRCLWANPPAEGHLRILYRRVVLGRTLCGYCGLPWFTMRDGVGPAVEMEVLIDGEPLGKIVHRDEEGWQRFELPLEAAEGRTADVEFRVSSSVSRDREFCFHAEVR